MSNTLLTLQNLSVTLSVNQQAIYAVHGLDLVLERGKTLALVGESGCGKSITALSILKLLPEQIRIGPESHIFLGDTDLLSLSEIQMQAIRGRRISIIFQEPMTSLNPVLTVGNQIGELLHRHSALRGQAKQARMIELLDQVGLPNPQKQLSAYPHQLSGGMRQRIMIAIALAINPDVLIADEPTTALDVTTQAQILELLRKLQAQTGLAILLITHDLGVVKQVADQVAIMYAGHIVERASATAFFTLPSHPYSQLLYESLPSLKKRNQRLSTIRGSAPTLVKQFPGCRFAQRCPYVMDICRVRPPGWYPSQANHTVRCFLYDPEIVAPEQRKETFHHTEKPWVKTAELPAKTLLLKVKDLTVHIPIKKGLLRRTVDYVRAVNGVSFELRQGEILALVGESGCGKTTIARSILHLLQITRGCVLYKDCDISKLTGVALRHLRREVQIIFQDPFSSLNPRMLVGDIVIEGMQAHRIGKNNFERYKQAKRLLASVGLSEESVSRYPHEFSGGQRQRICIARALAVKPKLIICDEPTSALDVSVQAQVLNLLKQLQQEFSLSYLFITHNLAVVAYLADKIAVMRQGEIVEQGPAIHVLNHASHPYTRQLLAAVPEIA